MAYYKIILEEKLFAGKVLCMAAHKVGEAGLSNMIAKSEIDIQPFFDDVIYSIPVAHNKLYKHLESSSEIQNVDKTIKGFQAITEKDQVARRITIPSEAQPEILHYGEFRFVRLKDIPVGQEKYKKKHKMALLRVCNSLYVALDTKNKTEKAPVVITIDAAF